MIRAVLLVLISSTYIVGKNTHHVGFERDNERIHYHKFAKQNTPIPVTSGIKEEESASFWKSQARTTLSDRLSRSHNKNVAKNVILFLGDGMSLVTLAAARALLGQRRGKPGEETQLSFEKFPYTGLSKTYCVDSQVADSACSATAYLGGVKGNLGTIGVTAEVKLSDCDAVKNKRNLVFSIAYLSQLEGKRTGIVTTTRITEASPAGTYAHTANRDWESDTDIINEDKDPEQCVDIAKQLIFGETGKNFNVMFGGGRGNFRPFDAVDENGKQDGFRSDNRDLITEWSDEKGNTRHAYVHNRNEMNAVSNGTEYVLGLFAVDHMDYNLDRNAKEQPSLEEMTVKAIQLLSQGDKGFFLFVEGGRIDHGHHGTLTRKALDETIELHKAVETANSLMNLSDTLIVVTSDHAHTMTLNGYPGRGNDILGIGGVGSDDLPYTTLSYANGPSSAMEDGHRPDVSNDNLADPSYQYPSFVPLRSETHGGEDVGIFARGPWAHLFTGVTEENVIPHIISYASCVGGDTVDSACDNQNSDTSFGYKFTSSFLTQSCLLVAIIAQKMLTL